MWKEFHQYYFSLFEDQDISLVKVDKYFINRIQDHRESNTNFEWTYNNKRSLWNYWKH